MEPIPKKKVVGPPSLNYSDALISSMARACKASSVWLNRSNNLACKAIALRAAQGPIPARDAAYMTTLLPFSFLLNTTPLKAADGDSGTVAVKDAAASGVQAWYWFYATLEGLAEEGPAQPPRCTVVASVTRVTVNAAEGVSAWVLNAAFNDVSDKNTAGTWRREAPVYLDDAHVRVDGGRGRVMVKHPHVHGHVGPESLALTFAGTGVQLSVTATSGLGLVRSTRGGAATVLSHMLHATDWGTVDGRVTAASILVPQPDSHAPHQHCVYHEGKAWYNFKALGVTHVSRFKEFVISMFSRKPMVTKFMSLRFQTKGYAVEVFLPDAKSMDTLIVRRHVKCGRVATVWLQKSSTDCAAAPVRYGLATSLTVLETYGHKSYTALPSVLLVDVLGLGCVRVTARTPQPLQMHDLNSTRFISVVDVTVDGSHQKQGEGVLEWVPGNLPRRTDVISTIGVDSAVIAASFEGNPHARVVFGAALLFLVLVYIGHIVLALSYVHNMLKRKK